MSIEALSLPTEAQGSLRLIAQKDAEISRLTAQLQHLQEHLNLLTAKRFGASSEKVHPDQLRLFNEAEAVATVAEVPIEVPAHQRRRGGRQPLPSQLPRIEIVHDLSEAEKICPHDGTALTPIGEEISEQLDIEPAKACPELVEGSACFAMCERSMPALSANKGSRPRPCHRSRSPRV